MSNPVIFVSLGPGEPDLITLKGLKALQSADCIFCPETRTASGQIFSRAADILHALDIPDTTLSRFALPMSKKRKQAFAAYDKVYSEASLLHKENKKVCIVAEGDAGFYSSVHYIFEKLQADNIPVQHIAGIPRPHCSRCLCRTSYCQPGGTPDRHSRYHYLRRNREIYGGKDYHCHHETFSMYRRSSPLHPSPSRI